VAALTSLGPAPTGPSSGKPVNGSTQVDIPSAEGTNLGFNTPGTIAAPGGAYDTEISLNTSLTYPPGPNNGSNYGLEAVANLEMDESLGIGGTGSTLTGAVGDLDLFRYSAPGVRSYSNTQTTSPYSYFSIDGGNTVLSYFNQTSGADFADWLSNPIPAGFQPQVRTRTANPVPIRSWGPMSSRPSAQSAMMSKLLSLRLWFCSPPRRRFSRVLAGVALVWVRAGQLSRWRDS